MIQRVINILFMADCFLFCLLTLGSSCGESFSSAAYRAELFGMPYGRARPVIDWIFGLLGQREHCRSAYFSACNNLPKDMQ